MYRWIKTTAALIYIICCPFNFASAESRQSFYDENDSRESIKIQEEKFVKNDTWLGVGLVDFSVSTSEGVSKGAQVQTVYWNSPAEIAGVKKGTLSLQLMTLMSRRVQTLLI